MKNNLATTGLSMSQATSISNLCYQRGQEISNTLNGLNNATRTFKLDGETYTETEGKQVPANIEELLLEKGKLHSVQAFLVSNIKIKDDLLKELRMRPFVTSLKTIDKPEYTVFNSAPHVNENWGWDQLTSAEFAEYLEAESHAAHIGQFIHKGGPLDILRKELPGIQSVGWISIKDGEKTPVKVKPHHKPEDLLSYHEKLAGTHRKYEQRVNYFKAKVKNLISEENARISKENGMKQAEVNTANAILRNEYDSKVGVYIDSVKVEQQEFETSRQEEISKTAALRISIDPRFQDTIDLFLKGLEPES